MGERVSILAPAFPRLPGGGARTYYEHANGLARRGYDVTVVHALNHRGSGPGRFADQLRSKVRDLRAGNLRRRVSWMTIDPRVGLETVDSFGIETPLPPADLRIGTFWRTTEMLGRRQPDGTAIMQLIQAYETWAGPADRVDAVWRLPIHAAVVSESLRQRGLALGVPEQRLHVVPNGLDHSVYRLQEPVTNRAPCVAFLAHSVPVKGLAEAVDVVRVVHEQRPDAAILAFGSSKRPAVLPDFVEYVRRPVGERLVEQVYSRASVFLCSSLSEGWGFPSMEAMACGAALVSTRNGGVDDFARHEDSALLCDVGDTTGLARSVLSLLADDRRRIELAQRGMASVAEFTWDASAAALARVVRVVLDDPIRVS